MNLIAESLELNIVKPKRKICVLSIGDKSFFEQFNLLTDVKKAYFTRLFVKLAENGINTNKKQFERIQGYDNVWEFKHRDGERIFCFSFTDAFVLCEMIIKKANKANNDVKNAYKRTEELGMEFSIGVTKGYAGFK